MIQRIQSLYLFFASILIALMLFLPLAQFSFASATIYLESFGTKSLTPGTISISTTLLGIWTITCALTCFAAIFFYKKRVLQNTIVIISMLMVMVLLGILMFFVINSAASLSAEYRFLYPTFFPVAVWILLFLASKGIRKDEDLVRSLDRIR